ncbi:MAG: methylenetetrahydrofolate reductase [Ilumatobacteraceae bacterium]
MFLLSRLLGRNRPGPTTPELRRLVAATRFELVPMKSVESAIEALPESSTVSVTCSPAKGIPATLELTTRLLDLGHHPIPHISARMVEGRDEVHKLALWFREHGLRDVFVVGGDAEQPHGPYADALTFLRDLLAHDHGLERIGVPAYPDGHPLIDRAVLRDALHAKQALITDAGVSAGASTQMCFDAGRVRAWLQEERALGLTVPIHLGVPGVVDRARLMTMGARLGVGTSLRYLRKNRATVVRMLAPGGYDPTDLVRAMSPDAEALGIVGLHSFTFNSVADTARWRDAIVADRT